jgi:GNAT superfamily N-acetyltransferase
MTIRLATPADLPKLPAIELSGAQTFRGMDVPEELFHDASPVERWIPLQAAGTVWVAEDEEAELVGFLAGMQHGERLHIVEFAVAQGSQGRGLGRRMIAAVIDWARREALAALSLTTFRNVRWNGPFYRSCGFEEWADGLASDVEAELAAGAAKGLQDRCAMRLLL